MISRTKQGALKILFCSPNETIKTDFEHSALKNFARENNAIRIANRRKSTPPFSKALGAETKYGENGGFSSGSTGGGFAVFILDFTFSGVTKKGCRR